MLKKLSNSVRSLLTLIISLQISLGSAPFTWAHETNNPNNSSLPAQLAAIANDPAHREHMAKWDKAADIMESGDIRNLPDFDFDPFQLGNQRVETAGKVYSFNDYQIEVPPVAMTGLRVVYDEQTRELIFEGIHGQNDRGENGVVAGRHIISNVDISGMVKDDELLSIIDSRGNLHVIPMDYVTKNVFKSPLPSFKNLWSPSEPIGAQKFELRYASPGLRPPDFSDPRIQAVLPRDAEGNVQISSGDLFVYATHGNERTLVGVFSRKVTYEKIVRGFKYLLAMLMQIYPANVDQSIAQKLLADIGSGDASAPSDSDLQAMPEVVRRALLHFSKLQVANSQTSINQQNSRLNRQFHRLNESDWQKTYTEIERVARAQSQALSAKTDENSAYQKKALDMLLGAGDLTTIWQSLYRQSALMPKKQQMANHKPQREWLKKVSAVSLKYLSPVFAIGTAWGYPYSFEQSEAMQKSQILSWMYQHAVPDVLKDVEYRVTLLASTISLIALWPVSVAASWGIGQGLKAAAAATRHSSSLVARQIQDLARHWSPLSNWQRITSFGMRFFGSIIYPVAQLPLQLMRQPTMVTALSNGLNPFQKITPNSNIGQSLGIQNSFRVGALNPFSSGNRREVQRELQMRAQGIIAERKKRLESLSWQIATLVVAEKEKVDPATISLMASGALDNKNLNEILSDGKLRKDWEATQETVLTYLKGIGEGHFDFDIKEVQKSMLEKHYTIAQEVARKIKAQDPNRKTLSHLWRVSRRSSQATGKYLLNLGAEDSKFLRTIFTSHYVSNQTERGFVPDHIGVVGLYAVTGERADRAHPDKLAADANGLLWTSGPHWADIAMNTYIHFFVAGSKLALVFQQVKAKDSDLYDPIEYLWADVVDRGETLGRTSYEWVANVLDPRKADISHYAIKGMIKRMTTIQAAFLMQLVTRMGLGSQPFDQAVMAWLIVTFAAQWVYAWPWDIIHRGTHLEEERINATKQQFKEVMATISQGLREPNANEAHLKIRNGYAQMVGLFEKYNPQALQALTAMASKSGYENLVRQYQQVFNAQSMQNMGYMVRLNAALRSGNTAEIARAESDLKEALASNGLMTDEALRMNASALLDYSLETSPIYTRAHSAPSWIITAGFGAVLTTILSIPLMVNSFDPEYLTVGNLGFWMAASLGGYWAYHKTLSKNGIIAKVLDKVDVWRAQRASKCEELLGKKSSQPLKEKSKK